MRISLIRSGSTERSPASVVTTKEKNDTSAITTSLGSSPNPSHSTSTGASSTIGTAWEAISRG